MKELTAKQISVLSANTWTYVERRVIAERAGAGSLEGLGVTLGSLVRRGLLERVMRGEIVHWRMTEKGMAAHRTYRDHRCARPAR